MSASSFVFRGRAIGSTPLCVMRDKRLGKDAHSTTPEQRAWRTSRHVPTPGTSQSPGAKGTSRRVPASRSRGDVLPCPAHRQRTVTAAGSDPHGHGAHSSARTRSMDPVGTDAAPLTPPPSSQTRAAVWPPIQPVTLTLNSRTGSAAQR